MYSASEEESLAFLFTIGLPPASSNSSGDETVSTADGHRLAFGGTEERQRVKNMSGSSLELVWRDKLVVSFPRTQWSEWLRTRLVTLKVLEVCFSVAQYSVRPDHGLQGAGCGTTRGDSTST